MQFRTNNHLRTQRLATASMFAALAMIFSYIEFLIPFSVGIPGVKLGLPNLIIIIALYKMDTRYAFTINMVRILISGLLFTGAFGTAYSLAGGILSFILMWMLKKTDLFSMIGVSMAGGVAHNMGQLLVASLIVSDLKMFLYFPVLMFSGLISGILIGIVAYVLEKKLPQQLFM